MPIENSKASEIKRLATPLTFKNSKAYDSEGNVIKCIETINDVRYIIEPREGILTEDEILQYAPKSKAASKIRLKRGLGNNNDVLLVHESLPWILGIFYMILICIAVPVFFSGNRLVMLLLLVLFIVPLIYLYRIFNLNAYQNTAKRRFIPKSKRKETVVQEEPVVEDIGVESLKRYEKKVNNLKVVFEVKEEVVRDLIEKRFAPPQLTYDKFINIVDSAHKLFYRQADAASSIINLAAEDTPRVQDEIESKISSMNTIIDQIERLTNELVINISNETGASEDVANLLDDMENLIDSVKDY
ncbi:hypothetical protein [uncultured Methanobrevibacter sp.]|uniref:hypothetical protein n=1 Tax=uncultured Methanobrevibacter sp. TaxID=253161 RepID=UPI0025EB420C|nr:hypothetical protein [uncultured Methanobrevibacter sp.]